jgi:4-hydroxybenzoate polyprenyltransferase
MKMNIAHKLDAWEKLMRLDKPIGILLLLWPTLWGLWAGGGGMLPHPWVVWIFVLGTVLMRSAGCVVNDWADRKFDGYVARTRERPMVTGAVSSFEALGLAAILAVCAFLLILPLNRLVIWLSFPALLLAIIYPFTKRFLAIPQAFLGIAFSFGIPMAFAALQGQVPWQAWALVLGNTFWTIAYDTEYAMVDRPDDLKIGIRTSAITFGRFDVLAVMICYALFLLIMAGLGINQHYGVVYFCSLLVAAGIAAYHYVLIRGRGREECFRAFLHNNWLGAAVFAGMVVDHAVRHWAEYPMYLHWLS